MSERTDELRVLAKEAAPAAVELRRQIHRRPELGWREIETTQRVASFLRDHGVTPLVRESGTGLTAEVGTAGPRVGFRADLDALPVAEETGLPFSSEVAGVMHACGHDAHTAIGAGIAAVLARVGDLPGRARVIFQPAEELIPGGAGRLAEEGVADGLEALIAFHVDPAVRPGLVGLRYGPVTGASDRVAITLTGPGGHTSRPHKTVDLVYAAARVAAELPVLLQRTTDPRHPVILTFGVIRGGNAANVIPTHLELEGTVRMFDHDLWQTMGIRVNRLVNDLVDPLGATAKVEYERGSPPVDNDRGVIDAFATAARTALGEAAVANTHQSMGSEDFSWFLQHVPGAMARLGAGLPDRELDLHSSTFDLDERSIEVGILAGAAALVELMERAAR